MMAQETSAKENNTNIKQTATTPVLIYQSRQHCLHVLNVKTFCWLRLHIYSLWVFFFKVYYLHHSALS